MGVSAGVGAIAAAVIGASATAYSVNSARKTEEKQEQNADMLAAEAREQTTDLPNTAATAAQMQASQQQAATAGGTITNNPGIGDASNTQRKNLLGS